MALGVSLSLGTTTAATQAAADNSTKLATTAYADAISGGGGGITQLTGDVTAGPGSGSQAATIPAASIGVSKLSATGTPSSSTYLRGDNTWDTPAGSTPAMSLIATQTPSGTGTGTFSSLGSYTDLRLVIRGRGTNASLFVELKLTFNGDTGANYDYEFMDTSAGTAGANQSFGAAYIHGGYLAAASASTGATGMAEILIGDYLGTTFHKQALAFGGLKEGTSSGQLFITPRSGWWRNTAAITSVTYTLSAGNFVAGSKISLYGIL